jgi:hypothetical protein
LTFPPRGFRRNSKNTKEIIMEIGDKVKFTFGKKKEKKEGTVVKLFPKTVYIETDFPNHKGKIVKRKRNELD